MLTRRYLMARLDALTVNVCNLKPMKDIIKLLFDITHDLRIPEDIRKEYLDELTTIRLKIKEEVT